jgi:sulfide dehydrogenase [flavocytochrome c] flavoprotein chain
MTPDAMTRRRFVQASGAAVAAAALPRPGRAATAARVVVVGGGFGGATAARFLADAGHRVTLVEASPAYTTCPFSNTVFGGFGRLEELRFTLDGVAAHGVEVVQARAEGVDGDARLVTLANGDVLAYDRLVLAPGVQLRFDALPGYDAAAAEIMPHAWKAGEQTALLRRQLEAMEDGGVVGIVAPANPSRCPPGPYERASLIAHYLKAAKPHSKVLILDAKDEFSKRPLFEEAWGSLYGDLIEWVPMSRGGTVIEVAPAEGVLVTDFHRHAVDVANVIPPQRAGAIADTAGVADATGWCPIVPETFESTLVPGIHVIGDACFAGAMPKSAFSANAQAKVCAVAIDALLRDEPPPVPKLINTCYSLCAPDYGITVAGVYQPADGMLADVEGAGGTSPLAADPSQRRLEADYARSWYATITAETFG